MACLATAVAPTPYNQRVYILSFLIIWQNVPVSPHRVTGTDWNFFLLSFFTKTQNQEGKLALILLLNFQWVLYPNIAPRGWHYVKVKIPGFNRILKLKGDLSGRSSQSAGKTSTEALALIGLYHYSATNTCTRMGGSIGYAGPLLVRNCFIYTGYLLILP